MKRQINKQGFAIVLLVFFIAIIGVETIILGGISRTMAFETNEAYLQSCRENLVISGLAWAEKNIEKGLTNDMTDLDITSLRLRRAELKVTVSKTEPGRRQVNITALCSVARQSLRANSTYVF